MDRGVRRRFRVCRRLGRFSPDGDQLGRGGIRRGGRCGCRGRRGRSGCGGRPGGRRDCGACRQRGGAGGSGGGCRGHGWRERSETTLDELGGDGIPEFPLVAALSGGAAKHDGDVRRLAARAAVREGFGFAAGRCLPVGASTVTGGSG